MQQTQKIRTPIAAATADKRTYKNTNYTIAYENAGIHGSLFLVNQNRLRQNGI